jgi:hypothetical protein
MTQDISVAVFVVMHFQCNFDCLQIHVHCIFHRQGLKPNGIIVIKENLASSDNVDVHEEDSSVTRPISLLRTLLKQAGLRCIKEQKQKNLPRGLYTVKMFAFVPDIIKTSNNSNDSYITEQSVTSSDNRETSSVN